MLDKKNKIDKLHLKKTPVKALLEVKKKIEMKSNPKF